MKTFYFVWILILLNSCGPGESPHTETAQDVPAAQDSAMMPTPGSDETPHAGETEPANATLGFSYYPVIPQNETRDLRVFVKIDGKPGDVTKTIREIEKEDLEFTKINESSVVCIIKNIQAYKKLSIKPIYDFEDFRITKISDSEPLANADPNEQELDFVDGNYWHWKVKAIAKTAHLGTITLLIKAETPTGQKLKLAERQINIKIDINEPEQTFADRAYTFADAHFKEILSLIVIPLVIFLFNIIRKRVIARKNNPST